MAKRDNRSKGGARIDIGHVAVFRSLVHDARVKPEPEAELFEAVVLDIADGDRIRLDHVDGTVEGIGLRSTRVRNLDGHLVTIPNKTMGNATITNYLPGTDSLTFDHTIFADATALLHLVAGGDPRDAARRRAAPPDRARAAQGRRSQTRRQLAARARVENQRRSR